MSRKGFIQKSLKNNVKYKNEIIKLRSILKLKRRNKFKENILILFELRRKSKKYKKIKNKQICVITGRSKGLVRKTKLSRIIIRDLFMDNRIPGLIKSSW